MELNNLQREVNDFIKHNNLEAPVEIRLLDLTSEVGELAKEDLKGNNYGKKPLTLTGEWEQELGDALFSLIALANSTSVNLESALHLVLDKYKVRIELKGTIGSEE